MTLILYDQHNAKILGCRDYPYVITLNSDNLASEGFGFENAITQNPICTPSRISYLSGQYLHNHLYYGNKGPNPGGLPNLLVHFRRNGYTTAAVGKTHCPEYWIEDDCDEFCEVSGYCSVGGSPEYDSYLAKRGVREIANREHYKSPWGDKAVTVYHQHLTTEIQKKDLSSVSRLSLWRMP